MSDKGEPIEKQNTNKSSGGEDLAKQLSANKRQKINELGDEKLIDKKPEKEEEDDFDEIGDEEGE